RIVWALHLTGGAAPVVSSGQGSGPFEPQTRVRIPPGACYFLARCCTSAARWLRVRTPRSRVTSGMMYACVRRVSTSVLNSCQTSFHLRERARSVANTERCPLCNVALTPEHLPRHLH